MDPRELDALASQELGELAEVRPTGLPGAALADLYNDTALYGIGLEWLRSQGHDSPVRGFGFGVRWRDGQPTDQPVFQVFAAHARSLTLADLTDMLPAKFASLLTLRVVRTGETVSAPTGGGAMDLVDNEPVVPLARPARPAELRARWRPLQGGCSIGHPGVTGGSLGIPVTRQARGAGPGRLVLSNVHVLARDPSRPQRGDPTLQPGSADLGDVDRDVVGRLADFEPLRGGGYPNRMDAALAELDASVPLGEGLAGVGPLAAWRATRDVTIGQRVAKVGRTTGLTFGVVTSLGVAYRIDYKLAEPLLFTHQIMTTNVATSGDSGSLLFALGARPSSLGLIIGGSADVTLASPIEAIHKRFDVLTAPTRWRPDG